MDIYNFVEKEVVLKEKKSLKSGQTVIIYEDKQIKIKLMKRGRKVFTVIVNYGDESIENIARNLVQAS